jgi:RNA polymerase-associated protein RTF1
LLLSVFRVSCDVFGTHFYASALFNRTKAPPRKGPGRPRRAAAAKKPAPEPDDMEESSDESSEDEMELDMDNMDQNQLIKDEEDKKYLDSLPEIEREAILAERFEERKAQHDMKQALREEKRRKREEKKALEKHSKKRKAPASAKKANKKSKDVNTSKDEEIAQAMSSRRSSTRDRDATGKKGSKAKALAALREERKKAAQKDESESSESDFGDDDEDSDDDYEEAGALKPWQKKAQEARKAKKTSQLDELDDEGSDEEMMDVDKGKRQDRVVKPAELQDYELITLPRRRLGRWCNEPYFDKAVLKCFVKLFVGEDPNGKRCYRLCRIVEVGTAKQPYTLPPVKKEKPVSTNKMLMLQFGANTKLFPIRLVSDAKVTQADITQYETAMKTSRLQDDIVGKGEAQRLRRLQDEMITNYTYTAEDIERQLKENKQKGATTANLGLEQTRAAIAVQAAKNALTDAKTLLKNATDSAEINDAEAKVEEAQAMLQQRLAEEQKILEKVKARKNRLVNRTKDQKWAKVNERAIRMNQQADFGAFKEKVLSADKGEGVFNPYARRKVKPKILWEVGQKDEKKDGDEKKDDVTPSSISASAVTPQTHDKDTDSTPTLVHEQHGKAAALSQSHQFNIDEEILAQTSFASGIGGIGRKKKSVTRFRKGISLADYQDQKAAGTL